MLRATRTGYRHLPPGWRLAASGTQLQVALPPPSDPDPIAASAVQELLGGKFGEMSTFMNCTYQSFDFRNRQGARPFYDLVPSIAAEELGHIELVATTINTMPTGAAEGTPGIAGGAAKRVGITPRDSGQHHDSHPEGEVSSMTDEQIKGKAEQAKGRLEQAQGDLTDDKSKKAEGILDEVKGKAREAVDKARDAIHEATARDK